MAHIGSVKASEEPIPVSRLVLLNLSGTIKQTEKNDISFESVDMSTLGRGRIRVWHYH